jgi:hypothetical protein
MRQRNLGSNETWNQVGFSLTAVSHKMRTVCDGKLNTKRTFLGFRLEAIEVSNTNN